MLFDCSPSDGFRPSTEDHQQTTEQNYDDVPTLIHPIQLKTGDFNSLVKRRPKFQQQKVSDEATPKLPPKARGLRKYKPADTSSSEVNAASASARGDAYETGTITDSSLDDAISNRMSDLSVQEEDVLCSVGSSNEAQQPRGSRDEANPKHRNVLHPEFTPSDHSTPRFNMPENRNGTSVPITTKSPTPEYSPATPTTPSQPLPTEHDHSRDQTHPSKKRSRKQSWRRSFLSFLSPTAKHANKRRFPRRSRRKSSWADRLVFWKPPANGPMVHASNRNLPIASDKRHGDDESQAT